MVLEYGDVSKLRGLQFFMLELRSEKTVEPTLRRIGKALPGIFRHDPIEIFVPVVKRDLDVFELSTGPYVFVRSTNFNALLRLKSVTGVVSLVTEGDSNRPNKAISVPDDYVQGLIRQAEEEHRKRAIGIEVGSFVRILNGETRDFCGEVEIIGDGKAVVRVTLRTKSILLETPVRNLLNLSHVPREQRVYYYGPLVDGLFRDSADAAKIVEEDLHLDEEALPAPEQHAEEPPAEEPRRHSRQRTVTALVKKLVLIEGLHTPMEIARAVVKALRSGEIKAPKNLFIVYCIIKDRLRQDYFSKIDPSLTNYREVIKKYGKDYKFSAGQIAKLDPDIGIPVQTVEVCKDGRSREARQKSKTIQPAAEVKRLAGGKAEPRKKRKKGPQDKCGECLHSRSQHKLSPKGAWMRCGGASDPKLHPWIKGKGESGPCWCKRFKEKEK